MRAVVTGAAGFAAGHLIDHLLSRGDDVCAVAKSPEEEAAIERRWRDRIEVAQWDVRAMLPSATARRLDRFQADTAFHLAAISIPERCGEREPTRECRDVNVDGAARVAKWCVQAGVSCLLFVSSAHVYGPSRSKPWTVSEASPLEPRSGYGKSKLEAERRVGEIVDPTSTRLVTARAFNHAGPGQRGPLLFPQWAKQFADPAVATVRVRSLQSYLDLSDVRDVVRAYRMMVISESLEGPVNVGSGKGVGTSELFESFCRVSGRRPQVVAESDQPRWGPVADTSRLVGETGYRPEVPLTKTIADTIAFFRSSRS